MNSSRHVLKRPKTSLTGQTGRVPVNESLRAAMAAAGLTERDIAVRLEVDPKTVERWVTKGRPPHRRTRDQLAHILGTPAGRLWPDSATESPARDTVAPEVETVWPTRSAVPNRLWAELVDLARDRIDICTYAALFLFEADAGFSDRLQAAAGRGAHVNVTMSRPDSTRALARGEAEGIGTGVQAMAAMAWTYLDPAASTLNLQEHDLDLPGGLFRFDDHLLWNPSHAGLNDRDSPVLHVRLAGRGVIGETALKSLDWVWSHSVPRNTQ